MIRRLAFSIATILLVGCGSTRSDTPDSTPELVGSLTRDGRSLPSGASGVDPTDRTSPESIALPEEAPDPGYGFLPEHPVKVGGLPPERGPQKEILYLSSLLGPEGQPIHYQRSGSCCGFATENSPFGTGLLDVYEVTYGGLEEPLVLYLNMYDPGPLYVPRGLRAVREQ